MCQFYVRVYRCGHYKKVLSEPCLGALAAETICEIDVKEESTAPGFCYLDGCDVEPETTRDGPGELPSISHKNILLKGVQGKRSNGGFDGDDIDWSEFHLDEPVALGDWNETE